MRALSKIVLGTAVVCTAYIGAAFLSEAFYNAKEKKAAKKAEKETHDKWVSFWSSGDVVVNGEIFRDFCGTTATLKLAAATISNSKHDMLARLIVNKYPVTVGEALLKGVEPSFSEEQSILADLLESDK